MFFSRRISTSSTLTDAWFKGRSILQINFIFYGKKIKTKIGNTIESLVFICKLKLTPQKEIFKIIFLS